MPGSMGVLVSMKVGEWEMVINKVGKLGRGQILKALS